MEYMSIEANWQTWKNHENMAAISWFQFFSVKWVARTPKKGEQTGWGNGGGLLGSPEGLLEVCGHKFKVRPASTFMCTTILGF